MNSWYHARSSANHWGGKPEDYLPIHEFIDSSKRFIGDARHRMFYHHTEGCWMAQDKFGVTIKAGTRDVPVREIAERHIIEDLGWLPGVADYVEGVPLRPWMTGKKMREVGTLNNVFGGNNE